MRSRVSYPASCRCRAGVVYSSPTADSSCECHYEGRTGHNYPSGEAFDSSYARGSPTSFAPDGVFKGFAEAISRYLEAERTAIDEDIEILTSYGPFRRDQQEEQQ